MLGQDLLSRVVLQDAEIISHVCLQPVVLTLGPQLALHISCLFVVAGFSVPLLPQMLALASL